MDEEGIDEIRVRGHVSAGWARRFDEFSVTLAKDGETLLTGRVADQAALHAMISRLQSPAMTLASVRRIEEKTNE